MTARRSGLIVRTRDGLGFVPAAATRSIVARPHASLVPGSPFGMALVSGGIAPTMEVGDGPHALVCELEGEPTVLSGVAVERAGFFDASEDGVMFEGAAVPSLNLEAPSEPER